MRCSVSQAWICDRVGSNYTNRCVGTAHSRRGGLERLPQRRWCKDAEFSASPAPLAGRSRYLLDIDPQLTGFHPRKV